MSSSLPGSRSALGLLAALCLLAPPAARSSASPPPLQGGSTPAPDVTKLGPQVGEKVPDFSLPDQNGNTRTLSSLMGPKGLVLVFSRSADW